MENMEQKDKTETPIAPSSGTVRLNGVTWPWMVTQDALDALKEYDIWKDDIWVTTYPKAGTHWVLEIVNLILVDGHVDQINRAQHSYPVEFDFNQPGRSFFGIKPPPVQYKAIKGWTAPRVVVTHLTEELMPTQIYQGRGKVIYVIRNPKDTTVSHWNFVKPMNFDPRYKDWDYFVQEFLNDETMVHGSWCTHVLGFWRKHRNDKNFLFLKYEDMKRDTKGAVIKIADFIGKRLMEDAIDRVVEFCSLENMKARQDRRMKNSLPDEPSKESTPSGDQLDPLPDTKKEKPPAIIRKGIVGDWKTMFTVAQNEAFDAIYREKMAGSGLTIEFE